MPLSPEPPRISPSAIEYLVNPAKIRASAHREKPAPGAPLALVAADGKARDRHSPSQNMWERSHWTFEEGNVQTKIININGARRRLALTAKSGSADRVGSLRRFGMAVVRDNWLVC